MGKFKKQLSNIKEQQKTKSNSRKSVWSYKKDLKNQKISAPDGIRKLYKRLLLICEWDSRDWISKWKLKGRNRNIKLK